MRLIRCLLLIVSMLISMFAGTASSTPSYKRVGSGSDDEYSKTRMLLEPEKETLLTKGKIVAGVPSTTEGKYWWMSGTEILTLRPSPDPRFFLLGLIDINTRKETPIEAFNKKFSKTLVGPEMHVSTVGDPRVEVVYNPPRCNLSPDRKWFLWLSRNMTWIAASLDGTKQRRWSAQCRHSCHGVWLRDSERWVELISYYQKKKYTIKKAVVRSISIGPERVFENLKVDDSLIIGASSRNHILIRYDVKEGAFTQVAMAALDFEKPMTTENKFSVQLAPGSKIVDVAISDSGEHLAWLLEISKDRCFPREYSLCISGLKGEKMRELGRVSGQLEPSAASSSGKAYYWPQSIRWLPDGQRVSFVFRKKLYVLDVY